MRYHFRKDGKISGGFLFCRYNMELEKINENGNRELFNIRDLHKWLGSNKDFSDWIKYRISQGNFEYREDFTTILGKSTGGRPSIQYYGTAEMCKKIAMMEGTDKGNLVRNYFLDMEKKAKTVNPANMSRLEILKMALEAENERIRLESENAILAPKAEFFDRAMESDDAVDMINAAAILKIPGYGRNKLFAFLRGKGVLMANNIPYAEHIKALRFRVIEQVYQDANGKERVAPKTLVYQRGLAFIADLIKTEVGK